MDKVALQHAARSQHWERMNKSSLATMLLVLLTVLSTAGCDSTTSPSPNSTPTVATPLSTATQTPSSLLVTSLVTSLSPASFSEINCGSSSSFTFSTVITVAGGSGGGQVAYIWNIGAAHIPGRVTFASGETSKTVTYTLQEANVQPGIAAAVAGSLSVTTNGRTLTSAPASVLGICTLSGAFKVVGLSIGVYPGSVGGLACGDVVSFTYTATVTIAPNSNGGDLFLKWSFSSSLVTLTFGPYQPGATLSQTIRYTLSGKLLRDNSFPPVASIASTSPNALSSAVVRPFVSCVPPKK